MDMPPISHPPKIHNSNIGGHGNGGVVGVDAIKSHTFIKSRCASKKKEQ
jgi:hypothetical protein